MTNAEKYHLSVELGSQEETIELHINPRSIRQRTLKQVIRRQIENIPSNPREIIIIKKDGEIMHYSEKSLQRWHEDFKDYPDASEEFFRGFLIHTKDAKEVVIRERQEPLPYAYLPGKLDVGEASRILFTQAMHPERVISVSPNDKSIDVLRIQPSILCQQGDIFGLEDVKNSMQQEAYIIIERQGA